MYPFTLTLPTTKKSAGKNSCKYILLHHTAGGSFQSNMKKLSGNIVDKNPVSTQFVLGPCEECGKIGEPSDIQWHAGDSSWGNDVNMNSHSMGIEVVGFGEYSTHQLMKLTDLVEYLMSVYSIPKENVLRHSDVTQLDKSRRDKKILRDGKAGSRKVDIALGFFPMGFSVWQSQLVPRKESRYKG